MVFCHECGNQVADAAKFCNNCGTKVAAEDPAAEAGPEVVEVTVRQVSSGSSSGGARFGENEGAKAFFAADDPSDHKHHHEPSEYEETERVAVHVDASAAQAQRKDSASAPLVAHKNAELLRAQRDGDEATYLRLKRQEMEERMRAMGKALPKQRGNFAGDLKQP